jgi:tRNA (cmo5U34)-methyltransferase
VSRPRPPSSARNLETLYESRGPHVRTASHGELNRFEVNLFGPDDVVSCADVSRCAHHTNGRRLLLEAEMKSTVEEIRQRFDADVERFSNLETGQSATVDAPLAMALIAEAAAATSPHARHVLDVGCGAGNYTLKLLERLPNLDATLIDLSRPMLERARERVSRASTGRITTIQADIRAVELAEEQFDIILAASVLHHLRTDEDWRQVFTSFHRTLRPGGSVWIFDLVESAIPAVEQLMHRRYGEYLTQLKDEAYRDHVFAYVDKEDTPRPLLYQLDLLSQVGFAQIEVLHKNVCFAAFAAVKA